MRETWVQPMGWEGPLEEGMATHSSALAWRIPHGQRSLAGTVHGVTKESDTTLQLNNSLLMIVSFFVFSNMNNVMNILGLPWWLRQ